ncbi:hypothetical protein JCM10213v2_002505 [Rhodosporidiobolus nylandii]
MCSRHAQGKDTGDIRTAFERSLRDEFGHQARMLGHAAQRRNGAVDLGELYEHEAEQNRRTLSPWKRMDPATAEDRNAAYQRMSKGRGDSSRELLPPGYTADSWWREKNPGLAAERDAREAAEREEAERKVAQEKAEQEWMDKAVAAAQTRSSQSRRRHSGSRRRGDRERVRPRHWAPTPETSEDEAEQSDDHRRRAGRRSNQEEDSLSKRTRDERYGSGRREQIYGYLPAGTL